MRKSLMLLGPIYAPFLLWGFLRLFFMVTGAHFDIDGVAAVSLCFGGFVGVAMAVHAVFDI